MNPAQIANELVTMQAKKNIMVLRHNKHYAEWNIGWKKNKLLV